MDRDRPPLTLAQILAWADDHKSRTSEHQTGKRPKSRNDEAARLPQACCRRRPERGRSREMRSVRFFMENRDFPVWCEWPRRHSGPIRGAPGDTWVSARVAAQMSRSILEIDKQLFGPSAVSQQLPDEGWPPHCGHGAVSAVSMYPMMGADTPGYPQ
jgi:hypothetical protein